MRAAHAQKSKDSPREEGRDLSIIDDSRLQKFSVKQTEFLHAFAASPYASESALCREIGIKPSQLGKWKKNSPQFKQAMQAEYRRSQMAANMDRKVVMRGMLEAIELARDMRQPSSMISGWKEVARMCGFYEPERREVKLSVDSAKLLEQIQTMPKEKLLALWHEREAVEAEFEVIDATADR